MEWYVLQVFTGREAEVQDRLEAQGIATMAPTENRVIRTHGKWVQREHLLFPGYVFVQVELTDDTYHLLRETPGVLRLLDTGGQPSHLSPQEVSWLLWLGGSLLEPSCIQYLDKAHYRIVSGVLLELAGNIVQIDRHRRRVLVGLTVLGVPRKLELSYKVV